MAEITKTMVDALVRTVDQFNEVSNQQASVSIEERVITENGKPVAFSILGLEEGGIKDTITKVLISKGSAAQLDAMNLTGQFVEARSELKDAIIIKTTKGHEQMRIREELVLLEAILNDYNKLTPTPALLKKTTNELSIDGKRVPIIVSGVKADGEQIAIREVLFDVNAVNVIGAEGVIRSIIIAANQVSEAISAYDTYGYLKGVDLSDDDDILYRMTFLTVNHFEEFNARYTAFRNSLDVKNMVMADSEFIRIEDFYNYIKDGLGSIVRIKNKRYVPLRKEEEFKRKQEEFVEAMDRLQEWFPALAVEFQTMAKELF